MPSRRLQSLSDADYERTVPLFPSTLVYAKRIPRKGLGVFARCEIAPDQEIECVPVLVLPLIEARAAAAVGDVLGRYAFTWSDHEVAVALGFGSLYNHAVHANAYYEDRAPRMKVFRARRLIRAAEEITINYNGVAGSRKDVGFAILS